MGVPPQGIKFVNPFSKFCVHQPNCTCVEEGRERWLALMILLLRDPKKELTLSRREMLTIGPDDWEIEWGERSSGDVFYKLVSKKVVDVKPVAERRQLT